MQTLNNTKTFRLAAENLDALEKIAEHTGASASRILNDALAAGFPAILAKYNLSISKHDPKDPVKIAAGAGVKVAQRANRRRSLEGGAPSQS